MRRVPVFLFVSFAASRLLSGAFAAEAFLKPNDVIALVGGEDMVAAAEYGYLELLLTRALPNHRLKFRCLAWEGDTVFEQRRDLNFPTWEEQLEKIGATVVVCQFGQMESLAGKEKLPEFIAAYEKLIGRFSAGGKRRIAVLYPPEFELSMAQPPAVAAHLTSARERAVGLRNAVREMAERRDLWWCDYPGWLSAIASIMSDDEPERSPAIMTRDGVHLCDFGQSLAAVVVAEDFSGQKIDRANLKVALDARAGLLQAIIVKNSLWDRYWRVQNWAFLAGDRTTQASSRDHLDPTKRWFPAEREQFLPLIEKKEQEIWALAAKLR